MIEIVKDNQDKVIAYCSYCVVDGYGRFDAKWPHEYLTVAYIDGFWVHPGFRGRLKLLIRAMILTGFKRNPQVKLLYFDREILGYRKFTNAGLRPRYYTIERFLKLGGRLDRFAECSTNNAASR